MEYTSGTLAQKSKDNLEGIKIESTSKIIEIALDEENKRLSFTVEGIAGTNGTTTIPIGKTLEGPYVVTIDGTNTNDFQVTKDQATGESMMTINYHHSTHQITIT